MQLFTNSSTRLVDRIYGRIGSALTLLLATPEVLAPEGRIVNAISDGIIAATIETQGMAYLVLLSFAAGCTLVISLIYVCTPRKTPEVELLKSSQT